MVAAASLLKWDRLTERLASRLVQASPFQNQKTAPMRRRGLQVRKQKPAQQEDVQLNSKLYSEINYDWQTSKNRFTTSLTWFPVETNADTPMSTPTLQTIKTGGAGKNAVTPPLKKTRHIPGMACQPHCPRQNKVHFSPGTPAPWVRCSRICPLTSLNHLTKPPPDGPVEHAALWGGFKGKQRETTCFGGSPILRHTHSLYTAFVCG